MCTVSWQCGAELEEAELLLYFNRDERRARALAQPPERVEGQVNYLAPVDTERGGTWIAVNELGCAVCILNDYSVDVSHVDTATLTSRGNLVRDVAEMDSIHGVDGLLKNDDSLYAPFTLLFWDGEAMCRWHWNLERLIKEVSPTTPLTSSSWDTQRVEKGRVQLYQSWVEKEGRSLESYHKHVIPGDAESSVCMARELTQTVSLCSVRITASDVQIGYTARDAAGAFLPETCSVLPRKESL